MANVQKPKFIPKIFSLKDFHSKRNQILLWHDKGGLGDVFMHRMLIEDLKATIPEAEIIVACLPEYHEAALHPLVSKVIDSRTVEVNDYCIHYNTCVSVVDRYENRKAPCLEHRSDIWAKYCGINLNSHEMNIQIDTNLLKECSEKIKSTVPTIIFAPVSKMLSKNLLPWQIKLIYELTRHCNLIGLHSSEIEVLSKLNIKTINKITLKQWIHYIAAADYVISVDTAAFHVAGGLKKPLMGIFSFADGKVYGKYFDFVLVQKHRDNGNWDCGPCFKFGDCPKCKTQPKPCITELTKEELETGISELFKKWPVKN